MPQPNEVYLDEVITGETDTLLFHLNLHRLTEQPLDYTEELINLHRGQGLDLFWRDSLTCPTEEEYMQMVLGSAYKSYGLHSVQHAHLNPIFKKPAACFELPSS